MAAAATAQEACSSISRCTYHVFLSFRGQDTRKNFTNHLYTALVQAGIHTFLDDDGIERGENIQAELEKAIKESKISIIVFSKDYASSRWCLDELVMIMERKKTVGLIVLPVFYEVDPSQVRKQTGSFNNAFGRHEMRFKEEIDKVEGWRAALSEVADLGGMVLGNRYQAQFIQDIVREIEKKLHRAVLNVDPHLVGIDYRVKDINWWLQDGSSGIATIFGIGGIGKTTIAKTVYNLNFERFQGKSFIANVRETLNERNGLVCLQNQLLSDILKGKMNKVRSVDEGIGKIKDAICRKKVLIVFDDVDKLDQLDTIISMQEWLYPGSKIIITTRRVRLLSTHKGCERFEVKELGDNESLQLFSWHAFGQDRPTESYMECSKKVVNRLGGLPLALKVLGSSLFGEKIGVWKSALHKLEAILDNEIQEVLKISYDSLNDDHDKNLFLDIACFFIGEDKDYTIAILDACDFYTTVGIQNLINRCLLTIDKQNKLMMHQLLTDMGREIIRQESIDDPGKRSRLCHHKDAFTVLKEKTGTEKVKGLALDLRRLMEEKHGKTIEDLETNTFKKMDKLKLLQLESVKLRGDYKYFSKNLIWLCWHGFPLKSIPSNFHLEKLVALEMCYSSLKHDWKGTRNFAELKFLDFSHSNCLVRTPDFSGLPSLEKLMLEDCINLVEVDESIACLERLVLLNLKDCKNLRKLPWEISMLESLEELNLFGCSKLDELPEDLRRMESLKVLHLDGIAINQLVSTTRDTKRLFLSSSTFWSWLSSRKGLHSTSFSLTFLPHTLVKLSLQNCNLSDDAISYGFTNIPSLKELDLSGNAFHSLPESINDLTMLESLVVHGCTRLQSLPNLPLSLRGLHIGRCTSLERAPHPPFLSSYGWLIIFGCEKLVEIEGLFKLEPVNNNDIACIKSLGLSNLESLGSIEVALISSKTEKPRKTTLQVLHECGINSIFLPGSEIPNSFVLKDTGSFISLRVHQPVGQKICGLTLCTLYAFDQESDSENVNYMPRYAKIKNKTKRLKWIYEPMYFARPGAEEGDMLWLSDWNLGNELEDGDLIDVSVVWPGCQVKMCGVCMVYEPEDKVTQSNKEETVPTAFPWYNTLTRTHAGPNAYFRCHHSFISVNRTRILLRDRILEDSWRSKLYELNRVVQSETCIFCETFDETEDDIEDWYESESEDMYEEDIERSVTPKFALTFKPSFVFLSLSPIFFGFFFHLIIKPAICKS